mgnify:CR=1 FL=1
MDSTGKFVWAFILSFIGGALTTMFAHWSKDLELSYYENCENNRNSSHTLQRLFIGLLVALRMASHYIAMLLAMSFNVPIFISLCLGAQAFSLLLEGFKCETFCFLAARIAYTLLS